MCKLCGQQSSRMAAPCVLLEGSDAVAGVAGCANGADDAPRAHGVVARCSSPQSGDGHAERELGVGGGEESTIFPFFTTTFTGKKVIVTTYLDTKNSARPGNPPLTTNARLTFTVHSHVLKHSCS